MNQLKTFYSFYCLDCHRAGFTSNPHKKCSYCNSERVTMMTRNPKLVGSNIWEAKPQVGKCPLDCNQCYYNRPDAYWAPIDESIMPSPKDVGSGIVRVNCGHDSNISRQMVVEATDIYKHRFFCTSISQFDFPSPVVFTANRDEEACPCHPGPNRQYRDLMFVRLRVSWTNWEWIRLAIDSWTGIQVPIVLTFMAYYDIEPPKNLYEYRVRHTNSYWCAKREFKREILERAQAIGGRLVTMCGTLDSNYCKDCKNCETYYWQALRRMKEYESCVQIS